MAILSRKWRGLAAALAGALGIYALAGFYLAPLVIQTQLWPILSQTLGGQIQANSTAFNPFRFSLAVDGASLKTPEGNPLVEIGEVVVNLDMGASLRTFSLVAKARIVQASVTLLFNKQGQSNYAFLIPKESQAAPASLQFPFLLTELTVEQGRLAVEDQSQGNGFKESFQPIDLSLANLGTGTETPAHCKLVLQGERKETLAVEGDFDLRRMALDGEAKLEGLGLAPLAKWLAPTLPPYAVRSGLLSVTGKFRVAQETGLEILAGAAWVKDLSLTDGGRPLLNAASISGQGLGFHGKAVELQTLSLESLVMQSPAPVELTSLKAQGASYQIQTGQYHAQTLSLDKAALKSPTPIEFGAINAQDLIYRGAENRVGVKSMTAAKFKLDRGSQPLVESGAVAAQDFAFNIDTGWLSLETLKLEAIELKADSPVVDKEGKARQFKVDSLTLGGLGVDLPHRSMELSLLQTSHAFLAAWRNKDGSAGVSGVPPAVWPLAQADEAPTGQRPWRVKLDRVELNDNTILLRDYNYTPPASMRLSNLNLLVKDYDSATAKPFWLGMNTALSMDGHIALEGRIKLSPLAVSLKLIVDDLSLPRFQAYLDPFVRIQVVKGTLNTHADIDYEEAAGHKLRIGGDVVVANFDSDDKRELRDFANWKTLRLDGLIFESDPQRLSIRDMTFTEPYLRTIIGPDQKFNIAENLSPPEQATPTASAKPEKQSTAAALKASSKDKQEDPLSVLIGSVNINQGNADFVDMGIKPTPFWIGIHDLNGNIRSLSSRRDAKSDLLLEGKLNQGSAVKIFGKINPFSLQAFTDITMDFNGVNLTNLSPYSAKFAGYRIEKGKVSMVLRYKLDNGQLTADNQFMLDQLELGERVESPQATTLPVRLAVSLLKDSDGKIDISLPISGDLSNPNVSIGGLLASASRELISKIVTSPLAILGGLFAGSAEDLESVRFDPGAITLAPQEKDKLAPVAKAMKRYPGLTLDIKGSADTELDRPALAEMDLARQLKNAKLIELGRKKGQNAEWDGINLSEQDYNRLFTNLYRWKNPDSPELQGLKTGEYLSGIQLEAAKRKLLAKWTVTELALRRLAQARGESIHNYLVQDQGLSEQRIYLLDVKLTQAQAREIKVMLSFSGS